MRKLIERKRDGKSLCAHDWESVVGAFMSGAIGEPQMAALCMASIWRDMTAQEVIGLTGAMVNSGTKIVFALDRPVVDKHSTGGVGDLVSLIVVPIVASCGAAVAKLSGRALGHTGGTLDKLESIPGLRTDLTVAQFETQVAEIGCAVASQSDDIVPADKRLYALRDMTGTVPGVGLIAASIVSKKIACGATSFVFDVKTGRGAFAGSPHRATDLATMLIRVAAHFKKRATAVVSNMDEPLGSAIGTGLEVIEARALLRRETRDERIEALCVAVGAEMLRAAGFQQPERRVRDALDSGRAYEKFVEMVVRQGATRCALESMEPSTNARAVAANSMGYLAGVDVVSLGNLARFLSARDSFAGIRVHKRIGDAVVAGEPLAELLGGSDHDLEGLRQAFELSDHPVEPVPLIREVLREAAPL